MRYAARTMPAAPRANLLLLVYLVAGAIVAATHHYYAHLHVAKQYGSAAFAILLLPLLLLRINPHIHQGTADRALYPRQTAPGVCVLAEPYPETVAGGHAPADPHRR